MIDGHVELHINHRERVKNLTDAIKQLERKKTVVGIPAERTARQDEVNNADLLYALSHGVRKKEMRQDMQQNLNRGMAYSAAHDLYLQEHGSPLWHVPPRPVLEPAVKSVKKPIAAQLSKAIQAALNNDHDGAENYLDAAGQIGEDAAKSWFDNPENKWPPNSPATR